MLEHTFPSLLNALTDSTALVGWKSFVQSASDAATDLADAKYLLIALVVLLVLYINLRLARWLSASIHFDPPHHEHENKIQQHKHR